MTDYVIYVIGQLASFGAVHARSMFGGFGLYRDGVIIGIIIDNETYFKTDKESEKHFLAHDSEPFSYHKDGKVIKMSYWKVSEQILENRDVLYDFAMRAYSVSIASKRPKK